MSLSIRTRIKNLIPRSLLIRALPGPPGKKLLLTFDDGPDAEVTPGVLDRLSRHRSRAVFFVVGKRAESNPDLLRRIRDEGHVLGNHTYTHHNTADPPFPEYRRDVLRCQRVLEDQAGIRAHLFRPPKGHLSFTSLVVPKLLGLRTVNWSLGVRDWACRDSEQASDAAGRLLEGVAPGQIVVLHDDNPCLLKILDDVLPRLRDRDYDLESGAALL